MKKSMVILLAMGFVGCASTPYNPNAVVEMKKRDIEQALSKEKSRQAEIAAKKAKELAEIDAKKAKELAEIDARSKKEIAEIDKRKTVAIAEEKKKVEALKAEQERLRVKWIEDLGKRYSALTNINAIEKLDFQSEIAWAENAFVSDSGEYAGDTAAVSARREETFLRAEYVRLLRIQRDGGQISPEYWTNIVVGAVAVGRVNVLKWAFPHVKDIDITSKLDPLHRTPLLLALGGQDAEMLNVIWKSQPNIDICDAKGATPLHYAMRRGSLTDVDRCLKLKQGMVNTADSNGDTPLYIAISLSRLDLAGKLLKAQAKVNVKRHDGLSPFAYACVRGELPFLELLEQHGSKPSVSDFAKAIEGDHLEMVKWFVDKRHFSVNDGNVREAAAKAGPKVRNYLLKRGANL